MTKRMLIDGAHTEETRIAVVEGNYLEDFDFENAAKKQLKGNIYLAKITRVEPSLQAAFVDYGGNRHGFLPFSEIHPDYYRIPIADREAMLKAERESAEEARKAEEAAEEAAAKAAKNKKDGDDDENDSGEAIEDIGGEDATDVAAETRKTKKPRQRRYKIQEVIQRRQVLLIQVSKEERGNKGAALTTYLSLPGRYCVLMPNSPRGGGISRKISNPKDRKRMKGVLAQLEMLEGMSVILRTAGVSRTKAEVKRDFEYLRRLWDNIRELTLKSTAPSMVYEEGNLVKRAIRDLYVKDIDEVLVAGEARYREAKEYMKMFMPSHAKKVQPYKDTTIPLFFRYKAESQIDAIHSTDVEMKSGGYIVINQTEALVAIDVNSGRSTKKRSIEETALHTNLEAADEVARQLRLRDLAGLVVIDFIDMDEYRNNHAVERRLKEALKRDRARIQVGRISPFGLMEMSRQRLRPSLNETSFESCPTCKGAGVRRSIDSTSLYILRALEEEGIRQRSAEIKLFTPTQIALFILNNKRKSINEIEARYNFKITLIPDDTLIRPDFRIERSRLAPELVNNAITTADIKGLDTVVANDTKDEKSEKQKTNKRTRRRGGRRHNKNTKSQSAVSQTEMNLDEADSKAKAETETKEKPKRRRRTRTKAKAKTTENSVENSAETSAKTDDAKTTRRRTRRSRKAKKDTDNSKSTTAKADSSKTSDAPIGAISETPSSEAKTTKSDSDDTKTEKPKRTRRSRRGGRKRTPKAEAITETAPAKSPPKSATPKSEKVETTSEDDSTTKVKSRRGRRGGRRTTRSKKTTASASTEEPAPAPPVPETNTIGAAGEITLPIIDSTPIFIEEAAAPSEDIDTAIVNPSHDDITLPSDINDADTASAASTDNFSTDENGQYDAAIERTLEANAHQNNHAEALLDDYNPIFDENGYDDEDDLDGEPDLEGEAEYAEETSLGDGSDYTDEAEAYLTSMMAEDDDDQGLDDDFDDEDDGEAEDEEGTWDDYSELIEDEEAQSADSSTHPKKKGWFSRLIS